MKKEELPKTSAAKKESNKIKAAAPKSTKAAPKSTKAAPKSTKAAPKSTKAAPKSAKTAAEKGARKSPRLSRKGALVTQRLEEIYPVPECALEYGQDPWKLLVMARLSAQCTDARVNLVSRELFKEFPDAEAMARGELSRIEELVRPCGLHRSKAQSIKEASRSIIEKHGGRVPDTMEELLSLSGVGRKIANLVLGDVFNKGGIVADTHCMRVCGRLGFYEDGKKDPLYTERVMERYVEKDKQSDFCHRIVFFGREWCSAARPACPECPLRELCDKYMKDTKSRKEKNEKNEQK